MTTDQGTARWARLIEIRDELLDIIELVPDGVNEAVVGLNACIMRLCPHDREQHHCEEVTRFESINRVTELRRCPHCRAGIMLTRRLDRSAAD
ncbi:MAG: hypothetical protein M3451_08320 [Chloroflexota bacterium]|nr:hypothetical protein [Chloroflexota bacterium]